ATFLNEDIDAQRRFEQFSGAAEEAEASGLAPRNRAGVIAFGSLFNFATSPLEWPLIRSRVFADAERAVGVTVPRGASTAEEYEHHVRFAEEVRGRLEDARVEVRDMLDVQSMLFLYSASQERSATEDGQVG